MKVAAISLIFLMCIGALGITSQANDTLQVGQPPCYADKCYKVIEDCPACCKVDCTRICFDENGNLEMRIEGVVIKKIVKDKRYYVSYDLDGDGKADLTINAHFSKCDDDPCGKIKGTITHKCQMDEEGVKKKNVCTFLGYARHLGHDDECCTSLRDLVWD